MRIVLNWQLGTNFGWGILGLNLFLRFCKDKNLEVMMGGPIKPEHLAGLDQLLLNEFAEKFISANKLWERRFEKEALEKKKQIFLALATNFTLTTEPTFREKI